MLLDIIPEGVIEPDKISMSLLDSTVDKLLENAIIFGQRFILAIIVFFIGRWVIKWLRKLIEKILSRRRIESTVKSFLDSLANISLKIILFILIVNILGVSTTTFAAVLAAAGLAIGMAMKDNLSNFAGGVMLLINRPFAVGNRIQAQSMDGVVKSIGILYTVLLTGDNKTIYMPNGPLSTGNIINFSTQSQRRIDIVLNMSYGADLDIVKESVLSIISSNEKIKQTPEPFVGITNVNNGTIDVTLRVWVEASDYGAISVYLNENIYSTFSQKGIYTVSSLAVKMLKD